METKQGYTPGPWKSERGSGDYGRDITSDNGRCIVAQTICSDHEANANLIAAGPELLAVAKGCLGYLNALPEFGSCRPDIAWFKPLIAVIAKADGGK